MMGPGFADGIAAQAGRRLGLGILGLLLLIFAIWYMTMYLISSHECHRECHYGNAKCREMCVDRHFCPFQDQEAE